MALRVSLGTAVVCLTLAGLAQAAIWPETLGTAKKLSSSAVPLQDPKLWSEYGLEETEIAQYSLGAKPFTATALRLQDPTGAMAAYFWQRPSGSTTSKLGTLAAETPSSVMLAHGNYVLRFDGYKPSVDEIASLYERLPRLDEGRLPALLDFFPKEDLVPGSLRYAYGPEALAQFAPGLSPALAALHLGAEVEIGSFHADGKDFRLALISYPTPQMARERLAEIEKQSQLLARRSGPLVAVVLGSADQPIVDRDEAERLLAQVRYQASISWSEYVPSRRDNIGDLIVNVFILIGFLLAFAAVSGLLFAGLRILLRKTAGPDAGAMITLHLDNR